MARLVSGLMALLFGLLSALLIFMIPNVMDSRHDNCTESVTAVISDAVVNDNFENNSRTYAPVYDYFYEGESFSIKSNVYTSMKPEIGSEVELMIDPDDPEKYFDPEINSFIKMVLRIVGAAMAVPAIVLTIVTIVLMRKNK